MEHLQFVPQAVQYPSPHLAFLAILSNLHFITKMIVTHSFVELFVFVSLILNINLFLPLFQAAKEESSWVLTYCDQSPKTLKYFSISVTFIVSGHQGLPA
jgi:hypothetical protein